MKSSQMKYLLALLHQPQQKKNQSSVARIFGVNKSTVSRALVEAVDQGILMSGDAEYELTQHGREYVEAYEKRLDGMTSYLHGLGVEEENARNDAYQMLDCCSEETVQKMLSQGKTHMMYERFFHRRNKENLTGRDLESYFDEGTYAFSFIFYKSKERKKRGGTPGSISMANDAFRHPGSLVIAPGGSYVVLGLKDMVHCSGLTGREMEGRLDALKYKVGASQKQAMVNDGKVYIAMEDIPFIYLENENLLYSHMEVLLTCTVGKMHMPESPALFVMYIR